MPDYPTVNHHNLSMHGGINERLHRRLLRDHEATDLLNVDISTPGLRFKRRAPRTLALEVVDECPVLDLTPALLPYSKWGAPYSATLSATGGAEPYNFTVVAGALPPGLSLDAATGVISGTSIKP